MANIDSNCYGRCSFTIVHALTGSSFFASVFLIKVGGGKTQISEIRPYQLMHVQIEPQLYQPPRVADSLYWFILQQLSSHLVHQMTSSSQQIFSKRDILT